MNAFAEPLILWHDDYGLGVDEIDEQHRTLFSLMNKAWQAVNLEDNLEGAIAGVNALERYASGHFADEEAFMLDTGYPFLTSHKKAHDAFLIRLAAERATLIEGGWISLSLMQFLKDWLISHILMADREYAAHAGYVPLSQRIGEELAA